MAVLADLERLFERVFDRTTARLFRAHPQAVQLERRVERAMERARVAERGGRVSVPARYRVRLHPEDLAVVSAGAGPEALAARLADASLAFARAHEYHLPGRPSVALVADPAVQAGVIEVDAVDPASRSTARPAVDAAVPKPAPPAVTPAPLAARLPAPGPPPSRASVPDIPVVAPRPVPPRDPVDAAMFDVGRDPVAIDVPAVAPRRPLAGSPAPGPSGAMLPPPAAVIPPPATASSPAGTPDARSPTQPGGIRGDGTQTLVFRRPAPAPTRAVLRVMGKDGSERTIEVDGTPLTLGRSGDNGLILGDARVSRHHARLQARRGTLVLTDLGSTNGSRVNGVRVDECALGTGDRVLIGDTVLLVEQLPG